MKETFLQKNFRLESTELINNCNEIVSDYLGQGLRLTLRQLYYQLVTKNIITNEEKSYSNLSRVVSDGRLAGLIDWDAIEDRIRIPVIQSEFKDLKALVDAAIYSYRLPRLASQKNYLELWVEKDALAGVLRPIARQYHITMMVNRGYSSQSAMYESAKRFGYEQNGIRNLFLLYLGDFDPSGEDMVRDISNRMEIFGVNVIVKKIALNMDQVKYYNPPPNPAKKTDPRSKKFIAKHGASSWEVDAINPAELSRIIKSEIESHLDMDLIKIIIDKENEDKERLLKSVDQIMSGGNKQ